MTKKVFPSCKHKGNSWEKISTKKIRIVCLKLPLMLWEHDLPVTATPVTDFQHFDSRQ